MDRTDSRLAHSPEPASDDAASPFNPSVPNRRDLLDFEPVPLRQRRDGLTPAKQREYVEALADCGVVREAAARVGISEAAINRARRRSDGRDFDRACEAAHMFGARRLRSIAFERAVEGTLKSHYYRGELVGQERIFDNRLLIYLLGRTGQRLEPDPESLQVCENWEASLDALEQGRPVTAPTPPAPGDPEAEEEEDPQVWREDGAWWTFFPPPEGFDGIEEECPETGYRRTLADEEVAVMQARNRAENSAELARCCAVRDRYFALPPRGVAESFHPEVNRNIGTSEDPAPPPATRNPGREPESRDEAGADACEPSFRRRPEPKTTAGQSMNTGVQEADRPCSRIPDQVRDDESRGGPPRDPGFHRDDGTSDIQTPPSRHPAY
ncbi:MAG TPA: hypothetical protein VF548_17950 [Allosphingosinicella sp.]|jgi:hypothetical protein